MSAIKQLSLGAHSCERTVTQQGLQDKTRPNITAVILATLKDLWLSPEVALSSGSPVLEMYFTHLLQSANQRSPSLTRRLLHKTCLPSLLFYCKSSTLTVCIDKGKFDRELNGASF